MVCDIGRIREIHYDTWVGMIPKNDHHCGMDSLSHFNIQFLFVWKLGISVSYAPSQNSLFLKSDTASYAPQLSAPINTYALQWHGDMQIPSLLMHNGTAVNHIWICSLSGPGGTVRSVLDTAIDGALRHCWKVVSEPLSSIMRSNGSKVEQVFQQRAP